MDCLWTSHKAGVTINYRASCNSENQSALDSILRIILIQLSSRDTSLQVFVLINYGQLSFPKGNFSNFFSIGFDTLREIDDDYIFHYYWNQESIAAGKNGGLNTFRSKQFPIDINATNKKKASRTVGIKIIYDIDYRLSQPVWNDLIKAVVYSARNSDIIKSQQHKDTVRYNTNGWYVSLATIDTLAIYKIIGKQSEIKKTDIVQVTSKPNVKYWLFGLLGLTIISIIIYLFRQYSR